MNIRFPLFSVALLLLPLFVGCGPNVTVTGKVTFPDGSPLTEGQVVFESPTLISKGNIKADGTYVLETGEDKGIPKGTYKVCIGGLGIPKVTSGGGPGQISMDVSPVPIDSKFLSAETSGLTCEVKGRTKYDIPVLPPQ